MTTRPFARVALVAVAALAACGDEGSRSSSSTARVSDTSPVPTTTALTTAVPTTGVALSAVPTSADAAPASTVADDLRLVVIGDSIPFNAPEDCPGCTGFVDRYAEALGAATGRPVVVDNLSERSNLKIPTLLDDLDQLEPKLRAADAIIVAAAHNTILLNADEACGTTWDDQLNSWADWSVLDEECNAAWTSEYAPMYEQLLDQIAEWRAGQPTILLALNKYNDWIGWTDGNLTPDLEQTTTMIHDAWNDMLCATADESGFSCVDVYRAFNGPNGDEDAGALLAADHAHPSDAGNEVIASLLVERGFAPLD